MGEIWDSIYSRFLVQVQEQIIPMIVHQHYFEKAQRSYMTSNPLVWQGRHHSNVWKSHEVGFGKNLYFAPLAI